MVVKQLVAARPCHTEPATTAKIGKGKISESFEGSGLRERREVGWQGDTQLV